MANPCWRAAVRSTRLVGSSFSVSALLSLPTPHPTPIGARAARTVQSRPYPPSRSSGSAQHRDLLAADLHHLDRPAVVGGHADVDHPHPIIAGRADPFGVDRVADDHSFDADGLERLTEQRTVGLVGVVGVVAAPDRALGIDHRPGPLARLAPQPRPLLGPDRFARP